MLKTLVACALGCVVALGIVAASAIFTVGNIVSTRGDRKNIAVGDAGKDVGVIVGDARKDVGVIVGGMRNATHRLEVYRNLSPYDERQLAHPYNPGPKIIFAPIPANVTNHRNLHLPDPVCLAGCGRNKPE